MDIIKYKNYLLSEIKINNPNYKLEIYQTNQENIGALSPDSLYRLGLKRNEDIFIIKFSKNIYINPREIEIKDLSNILGGMGIKNNIMVWHNIPVIKFNKKYYNIENIFYDLYL